MCVCVCVCVCKSWKQHPTKQPFYVHLPPIPKTMKRHVKHCWRSNDKFIVTFSYGPLYMDVPVHYGIVLSEFVLQSRYYVHFRVNTLGKV